MFSKWFLLNLVKIIKLTHLNDFYILFYLDTKYFSLIASEYIP